MPEEQEITETTPRVAARRVRSQIRITRVSVEQDSRTLTIKMPIAAARYLNLGPESTELFATPTGGVVQLSSFQPNIAIPVSKITEDDFVAH